ncbi:MAG: hypothetical protein GX748_17530 [Lentisphaerae bacterium]|jgi:hypothetical protein|nr:hypothetical protein [Kiritimatiellia bacterium]MDX9793443.1 hypothetical protein [Kiritimatiellia bacterium]NLC82983.1 hypothetical protein [Lentisphaerota bacterium]
MDVSGINTALRRLCDKYGVTVDGRLVADAEQVAGMRLETADGTVPLLPWRVERRYVELKKIIDGGTLEQVSTLRFAVMRGGARLEHLVYREFDLCEWMAGSPIRKAFAAVSGGKVANVIATLANGMSASVECSAALPEGAAEIDRHEIIARRGVACDRVVDTQVPQASIYAFTADGVKTYTDTDAELFGFSDAEIWAVRAAFAVLKAPALAAEWKKADCGVKAKVTQTLACAETCVPAVFSEEIQA